MNFPIPTPEEVEKQAKKFEVYDYYGIPYGQFDGDEYNEGDIIPEEVYKKITDREEARLLIMKQEKIPEDLAERLLKYKEQDAMKKNKAVK